MVRNDIKALPFERKRKSWHLAQSAVDLQTVMTEKMKVHK